MESWNTKEAGRYYNSFKLLNYNFEQGVNRLHKYIPTDSNMI